MLISCYRANTVLRTPAYAAAPPFQIEPAPPGFDLVLGADLVLGGDLEAYLRNVTEYKPLDR